MQLKERISTIIEKHAELALLVAITAVNAGNYALNLVLGRLVGPEVFAEVSLVATLSLIFSFIGVGLQMTAARISADKSVRGSEFGWLLRVSRKYALVLTALLILVSGVIASYLNMSSVISLITLFVGLPFYLVMSTWRGKIQGEQQYVRLASSFGVEMFVRLAVTITLCFVAVTLGRTSDLATVVSLGLLMSYIVTYVMIRQKRSDLSVNITPTRKKLMTGFMLSLGLYELAQIIINHSDVILVKHYFEDIDAGTYAALALIGRVVYFGTWSIVMVMLPKVVSKASSGQSTTSELLRAIGLVASIGTFISVLAAFAPDLAVSLFFGDTYLAMSPLLWKYALATTLFASSNVVAYYYVSLDQYTPVVITLIFGVLQVVAIHLFHETLNAVVVSQIFVMACLTAVLTGYHFTRNSKLIYHEGRNRITLSAQ